jgi:poly(ADP-ribose) glycohydrolase ARH3
MSTTQSKARGVRGAVLGLALGDAFGAPHEGGVLERLVWRLIGCRDGKRRWTDDTQMTVDVIESLIHCRKVEQSDLAARFARSYRWSRGYGPGAARVLKRIRRGESWESASRAVFAEGSYGNGGAMRSPVIGLFFGERGLDAVAEAAEATAIVTHAHPLAREGAVQIAVATALAFQGTSPRQVMARLAERARSKECSNRVTLAMGWLAGDQDIAASEVASRLGRGTGALESCTTAVYVAMRFLAGTFEDLLRFTIEIGGDVDTIAAMSGGIWGAARGIDELPKDMLAALEDHQRLVALAARFAQAMATAPGPTSRCT